MPRLLHGHWTSRTNRATSSRRLVAHWMVVVAAVIPNRANPPRLLARRWRHVERDGTCPPIETVRRGRSGCNVKFHATARSGTAHLDTAPGRRSVTRGWRGKSNDRKMLTAHALKSSPKLSDRRYFLIRIGCHASFPSRTNLHHTREVPQVYIITKILGTFADEWNARMVVSVIVLL